MGLYITPYHDTPPFSRKSCGNKQGLFYFDDENWTEEVKLQIREITHWGMRTLKLWNNDRTVVLKQIAHIHFTALTWLHLADSSIESIEGLVHMRMAHIEQVYLGNNNITSVGIMRKAAWPGLKLLSIYQNYLRDTKKLVQGCFLQIQALYVSIIWEEDEEKNQSVEQCFPAKMQATCMKHLSIQGSKFCFDRSVTKVLQYRWPKVCID